MGGDVVALVEETILIGCGRGVCAVAACAFEFVLALEVVSPIGVRLAAGVFVRHGEFLTCANGTNGLHGKSKKATIPRAGKVRTTAEEEKKRKVTKVISS